MHEEGEGSLSPQTLDVWPLDCRSCIHLAQVWVVIEEQEQPKTSHMALMLQHLIPGHRKGKAGKENSAVSVFTHPLTTLALRNKKLWFLLLSLRPFWPFFSIFSLITSCPEQRVSFHTQIPLLFSIIMPAVIFDLLCCFYIQSSQYFFNKVHMRLQHVVAKWVRKSAFSRAGGFTCRNNKGEGVLQCHVLSLYFTSFIKSTCKGNLHIMAYNRVEIYMGSMKNTVRCSYWSAKGLCVCLRVEYARNYRLTTDM